MPDSLEPAVCRDRAREALAGYERAKGRGLDHGDLTDILTDLCHLAREEGWDFEAEARNAITNTKRERGELPAEEEPA